MDKHYSVTTTWACGFKKEEEAPSYEQAKNGFEIYIEDPECVSCVVCVWTTLVADMVLYFNRKALEV